MRNPLPLLIAIILGIFGATSFAQEWTRFRGPGGSGISKTETIPAKFTIVDYDWKVTLPGVGHSSPVVWGDQVFLTVVTGGTQREVISYDSDDGSQIWSWASDFVPHNKHRDNEFASSTPCLDPNHLYIFWTSDEKAEVIALTHGGKLLWGPLPVIMAARLLPFWSTVVCSSSGMTSTIPRLNSHCSIQRMEARFGAS